MFFVWGCYGLREGSGKRWAKSLFGISLLYLVLLFGALLLLGATIYLGLSPDTLFDWIQPALQSPYFHALLTGGAS